MINQNQIICIDEYGDPSLEIPKKGVTEYFILTAIIIDEKKYEKENKKATNIISEFFPKGELKSSKISLKKTKRRIKILDRISNLDFHFYSIVFEKASIKKDSPLQYKKSFIKYLNKQLYETIFTNLASMRIYADEHGHPEFMVSFEKYILDILEEDLFVRRSITLVKSENYPFVQIADLISGSLAKIYESKISTKEVKEISDILNKKSLRIDEWPIRYKIKSDVAQILDKHTKDPTIINHAIRMAEVFISKNENSSDPNIQLQIVTIKYLLFNFKFVDPIAYVSTRDIIKHIFNSQHKIINELNVRMNIISKLRDSNVIISSSSNGYKIPINISDLHNFVDRTNSMILPMLERVKKARDQIKFVSKNNIDILDSPKYEELKNLIK